MSARDPADRDAACLGAREAFKFFEELGLPAGDVVNISIVARMPPAAPSTAAGCYVPGERRIYVLSYAEFRRRGRWFDVPVDRAMHRSVVTHEVAHALTRSGLVPGQEVSWHGREYVAYVVMLATMPPALRQRVLSAQPGTGFDHVLQITALHLAFHPAHFAAQAYRHYLKPENGSAFLLQVLRGEALPEE